MLFSNNIPFQQPYYQMHQSLPSQFYQQRQPQVLVSNRRLEHINCIEAETQDMGGLYLGDIICTIKPEILHNYRIEALVSCLGQQSLQPGLNRQNLTIKMVPAHDTMDYPIHLHFEQCYQFIQRMRRLGKNVLVHCHAGVSRSVTIVCAYFMLRDSLSPDQTLKLIQGKRQRARPNPNFWNQLLTFHGTLQKSLNNPKREQFQQLASRRQQNNETNIQSMKPLEYSQQAFIRGNRSMLLRIPQHQIQEHQLLSHQIVRLSDMVKHQIISPSRKPEINKKEQTRQANETSNSMKANKIKTRIPWDKKKSSDAEKKTQPEDSTNLSPKNNGMPNSPNKYISLKKQDLVNDSLRFGNKFEGERRVRETSMYRSSFIVPQHNSTQYLAVSSLLTNSFCERPSQTQLRRN